MDSSSGSCALFFGEAQVRDEKGFALLLVVFAIALATMLVLDFAGRIDAYQRSSRSFTEQVQGTLMLKSAVNLAKLLVEAPKPDDTKDEDWLYEAWNNIASVPSIPLEGLSGELRLMIVDEDGKIDVNAIQGVGGFPSFTNPSLQPQGGGQPLDNTSYWRNSLRDLFERAGFVKEQYPPSSFRTLGNVGYDAGDQVAVIADWIDRDSDTFQVQGFDGAGIEGSADKAWFYNRPLRHLAELAAIPGMTLERVQRIAPFVKVSPAVGGLSNQVNVNTAPLEVLLSMGFPPGQAEEIVQRRLSYPYSKQILSTLTAGAPDLANRIKVNSSEFSAYARIRMPSRTFWVRAVIGAQAGGQTGRKASIKSLEFY